MFGGLPEGKCLDDEKKTKVRGKRKARQGRAVFAITIKKI
jgi:hypothetical protein